jgi:hypothetical protein
MEVATQAKYDAMMHSRSCSKVKDGRRDCTIRKDETKQFSEYLSRGGNRS